MKYKFDAIITPFTEVYTIDFYDLKGCHTYCFTFNNIENYARDCLDIYLTCIDKKHQLTKAKKPICLKNQFLIEIESSIDMPNL